MAAIVLAALPPLAHAGLEINYSIDGGTTVTCGPVGGVNPAVLCPNIDGTTTPPLTITFLGASSNSPGGATAKETSATVDLENVDLINSHTIVINVISTGFLSPQAPPAITLLSHVGGSVPVGSSDNLLSMISCVDTTNSQTAGCPASFNAPTISPSITGTGSFNGDSKTDIASLASPYALDEQISLTLGAGASLNFSASSTLVQTPEPMSIVLLGSFVLLSSRFVRRRLKGTTQV